jgi:drug/metabolite transporter (DMT)-like permease
MLHFAIAADSGQTAAFMPRTPSRGVPLMLAAVAIFSILDASMKRLTQSYPPFEVSCLRGLASIPIMLAAVAWLGQWRQLLPVRWSVHTLRGALAVGMLTLFVFALKTLPLTEAYAIFLCAPLMVTALSALLLHERVGWHRWLAVSIGLLGVMTMLRPNASHFISWGAAAALGSALCYSFSALMIRALARTESTLSIAFSFMVAVALANGAAALPHWLPLQGRDWPWIVTVGITGALGQLLIIEAFRAAPPSVIAPFEYTALLFGLVLDWILWGTLPDHRTLIGGAIVTVSGLYVVYREHLRASVATVH